MTLQKKRADCANVDTTVIQEILDTQPEKHSKTEFIGTN